MSVVADIKNIHYKTIFQYAYILNLLINCFLSLTKNMKNIKLISFDGDGTLWYPKTTTTTQKPHRIYEIYPQVDEANAQLILIPGTIELLECCRGQ
jgi:hypothetical protein